MNGILVVEKPPLLTSHDVVDFIRTKFKLKKVGHAGTLDPLATGILIILLGSFTKKSIEFTNADKEYEGTLVLGIETDSGDSQGKVLYKKETNNLRVEAINNIFSEFIGEMDQTPPMVSSLKYRGKPLYKLARGGIEVERQPRRILVRLLEIIRIKIPEIDFRIVCSKGTYVRQLAIDIGQKIGCGAHLSKLKRIRSGSFSLDRAISWEKLQKIDKLDDFLCR
jgi:tRNA pseudouridine55 synthase